MPLFLELQYLIVVVMLWFSDHVYDIFRLVSFLQVKTVSYQFAWFRCNDVTLVLSASERPTTDTYRRPYLDRQSQHFMVSSKKDTGHTDLQRLIMYHF